MKEINRIVIPVGGNSRARPLRSLLWHENVLVDWVGGSSYHLDGSVTSLGCYPPYRFDHTVASPNGKYVALLEKLGTKGVLLKEGKFLREINRSYYCANSYEYPLAFLTLPDGQTGLVHCPQEYNELEIEEVETGRPLTQRTSQAEDFFHSHLSVSADGRYLASSGWFWHPFEAVCVYSIEEALEKPKVLDDGYCRLSRPGTPVNIAVLSGRNSLVFTTTDSFYNAGKVETDETHLLPPDNIGVYCTSTQRIVSQAFLEENAGIIVPLDDETVLGFYRHPKLIDIKTGKVIARWDDLDSGRQMSCITHHEPPFPVIAVDAPARRFALASPEAITVIQLAPGVNRENSRRS